MQIPRVMQAPIGPAATPELVAAVCEAGGDRVEDALQDFGREV